MNKKTALFLASCSLAVASSSYGATDQIGPKWCQETTVTGIVKRVAFKHPFNGSNQVALVVVLESPLKLAVGDGPCSIHQEVTVKEIQVLADGKLAQFIGKPVKVSGTLDVPETAYHIRNALLFGAEVVEAK